MRRSIRLVALFGSLVAAALTPAGVLAAPPTVVHCGAGASLQAAINAAHPGDVLVVRGTCVGTFVISKNLVLEGRGGRAVLDAGGAGTTLTIPLAADQATTAKVRITGVDITGGDPAGIENWGFLTLRDSAVRGNTGGGIANSRWGTVALERSTVTRNAGNGIMNNGEFGGGSVTLQASTVSANTGTGITDYRGTVTVQRSVVRGNRAGGISTATLGGVILKHSTVSANTGFGILAQQQGGVVLDHSIVRGNLGRGIRLENGSVTLDYSTVRGNTEGGISSSAPSYLTVRHSLIAANTAATFGGGIYIEAHDQISGGTVIENSTIRGNSAGVSGGGIYNGGGPVTITNVTFHNNTPDDRVGC